MDQSFHIREANAKDMTAIYSMGFDAWSNGESKAKYLDQCQASEKYARGLWYVLEVDGVVLSSLIVYRQSSLTAGIGSLATSVDARKRGYASILVSEVLKILEKAGITSTFLYSDIEHRFYEKFDFKSVPQKYQKYKNSVCMVRPYEAIASIEKFNLVIPDYF
jgi:predicted N-acetyltransferase YhbS